MRKSQILAGLLFVLPVFAGCQPQKAEFALPEGNAENGQALFVSYGCTSCHTVRDISLPAPEVEGPVRVSLGGGVSEMKSYAELVTSVINPSHELIKRRRPEDVSEDGESLMMTYNDVMTVSELSDLVAFLDSRYEKIERPKVRYRNYSD